MKIKDILKGKGPQVFTIGEEKQLRDAIKTLVNNNIGSLLVIDSGGKISGIITERDILRASNEDPVKMQDMYIRDVMTKNVIVAEPEDDVVYAELAMTQNHIRHLPILRDKVLVGVISIGDLVKNQLKEVRHENKYLRDYIGGNVA
ncbi:MAG: CBS domain-containing protein [Candidatus Kapaibacterium sp.]